MILKLAKTEREELKKDPLRATLAAAIEAADAAEGTEGPPRTQAIERGRALIAEREIALADPVASIEKARGNEGRRMAAALAAGRAAPSDDLMRSARANALEAGPAGRSTVRVQRLEEELAQAEEEVRRRRQAVSVQIGNILAAEAGRLLHRAHGIKKELGELFAVLSWLSGTRSCGLASAAPEGLDVADLIELDQRRAVFSDLAFRANLRFHQQHCESRDLLGWARWREALRHDADAAPPED